MSSFEYVTTQEIVDRYESSVSIFGGLLKEMRELSKKRPEATLNQNKVKILNRVLDDLREFLQKEPEGKYLDPLDDDNLPQNSDAVLVMVQYEKALHAFYGRYRQYVRGANYWITEERLSEWSED
jgi:hypothetical protein